MLVWIKGVPLHSGGDPLIVVPVYQQGLGYSGHGNCTPQSIKLLQGLICTCCSQCLEPGFSGHVWEAGEHA